jgi:formylglycine-generating enzyme required for sulfatase activity
MMGCSKGDSQCLGDENPAHQVTLTKGFWIGQTEVTQEAYQRVTGKNPSEFKGARLPVEDVSWNEAQAYCRAVGMRLPTEAEWEYAARGGDTSARYGTLDAVAWYDGNSGKTTHEVGQKRANMYGLYDMLGNVWEWVADWYDAYDEKYYGQSLAVDPAGPGSGTVRVVRGDSWYDTPRNARVSIRDKYAGRGRRGQAGRRERWRGRDYRGTHRGPGCSTGPPSAPCDPECAQQGRHRSGHRFRPCLENRWG